MAEVRIPTTAEEWEAKRAVITRLYSSDGLTLAQVQKTLKDVHGFRATYVYPLVFRFMLARALH